MIYKKKDLVIDGFKLESLGKKYSTPLYCYSFKKIKKNIVYLKNNFKKINPLICFAVKANSNKILLQRISKLGLGADVVSIGELMKALKSGIKPNKIVFSGVGKNSKEIIYAVEKIFCLLTQVKKWNFRNRKNCKTKRKSKYWYWLNPNIDAQTLNQISLGKRKINLEFRRKIFWI